MNPSKQKRVVNESIQLSRLDSAGAEKNTSTGWEFIQLFV